MSTSSTSKSGNVLERIRGGLIVSCQAQPDEPMHGSHIMVAMAWAASQGGAVGIRANSTADISQIRKAVDLPIIGILKQKYSQSPVNVTPTMREIDRLAGLCEIIATDATERVRPGKQTLAEFFAAIRSKYPKQILMADCATFEDGAAAAKMGFDIISTALCGYTDETKNAHTPDFDLVSRLVKHTGKPIVAEGNITTPEDMRQAMRTGAYSVVVGSAITRPQLITKRFVDAIGK